MKRRVAARTWAIAVAAAAMIAACGDGGSPTAGEPDPTEVTATAPPTPAGAPAGLIWADEFDGPALDTTRWRIEHSTYGAAGGSSHCYQPDNVEVRDGMLVLRATVGPVVCRNGRERPWASGMVRTDDLASWTHGRFVVRLRAPAEAGMWSAAWLGSVGRPYGEWPNNGEIDIVEIIGREADVAVGTAHWAGPDGRPTKSGATAPVDPGSFHEYGLTWTPTEMVWDVDGVVYHRVDRWDPPARGTLPAPFDHPYEIRLNLAVGGDWPGEPDQTTAWPAELEIDWVRVYALDDSPAGP